MGSAPEGQLRRIPGNPPQIRCASTASIASRPNARPVSARLSGPSTRLSARDHDDRRSIRQDCGQHPQSIQPVRRTVGWDQLAISGQDGLA